MSPRINLKGQEFHSLKVIKEHGRTKARKVIWECLCTCGNKHYVVGSSLLSGNTKSCGHLKIKSLSRRNGKHNASHTKLYFSWQGMKNRCNNYNNTCYKSYGGRGIKVCDRWMESFENFHNDMGERPEGMTLERIDNNGDYAPENCRWATRGEQTLNTRKTIFITYKKETKPLMEWAKIKRIPPNTLRARVKMLGWSDDKAIKTPVRKIRLAA